MSLDDGVLQLLLQVEPGGSCELRVAGTTTDGAWNQARTTISTGPLELGVEQPSVAINFDVSTSAPQLSTPVATDVIGVRRSVAAHLSPPGSR